MTQALDYQDLIKRLSALRERRAVLAAQANDRLRERAMLEAELKAAGVNILDLEGEIKRLRREAEEHLAAALAEIEEFESLLNQAAQPQTTSTGEMEIE